MESMTLSPPRVLSLAATRTEPVRRVSEEDQHWIDGALAGDARAFEHLYRKHAGRVYALCLRMTGNPSLAEELAQDAFVRAWEKLDTFRGNSQFGTWLHRLTVNVVLTALRSRNRRNEREFGLDDLSHLTAEMPPREPGVMEDLEKAIASLPAGARTVFVLHDVEGYKHEDIAQMTGTAAGTCKAQLHRARRLLRERLS